VISVIVPAHNEAAVIERSVRALVDGAAPGEIEVVVVCNGCSDATAEIARAFGEPVRVIETDVPSKSNAMNLGDAAATGFPRIYLDADVVMSLDSVRALAAALERGDVLAAAPAVRTIFPPGSQWMVRAYYDFWMSLPYIQEGMMAAGVYAVSREGRQRFDRFPDIIADDGYFRLQFGPGERVEVAGALSTVSAPSNLGDLIKIKTRSRLGVMQLMQRYPERYAEEARTKQYGGALMAILKRPGLYLAALPYLWVNLVSRYRARRQMRRNEAYVWERDDSSRSATAPARP
jgi:glycosyltransferase involved in cell wall biosynthesis